MTRPPAPGLAALLAAPLWLAALMTAVPAAAQPLRPVPQLEARVTDLTGTLTQAEQAELEAQLAGFESRKVAQIAVLIVPSTEPEAIEQYSIRVVDAWKLGRAEPDDGALLLVAKDDRNMRIEVGRGLEGALTDLVSKRIIADTITPFFRQGDFAGGIAAGVGQMIRVIDGEPLPVPDRGWGGGTERLAGMLPFLFGVVFVGSMVLRAIFGRALGSVATGGSHRRHRLVADPGARPRDRCRHRRDHCLAVSRVLGSAPLVEPSGPWRLVVRRLGAWQGRAAAFAAAAAALAAAARRGAGSP